MENRWAPLSAASRTLESTLLRAPATRLGENTTSRIATRWFRQSPIKRAAPRETRMQCAESLRAQAYFDCELDSPGAAEIERHALHCGRCCRALQDLQHVRTALRWKLTYMRAPPALHTRIARALNQESTSKITPSHRRDLAAWRPWPFWQGAFTGIGGVAMAASLAFLVVAHPLSSSLPADLLSAHVRSLMPEHLIDVVSTNKHTVKPWFSGHTDVSPTVADFELQGYKLLGGRADYFDHQRVAVVVYQHRSHVINVFSWDRNQSTLPNNTGRDGYHLAFWESGDLAYCAVSDTGWDELLGLEKLIQDLSGHDS
jgi:anti-sigma factor RsiW